MRKLLWVIILVSLYIWLVQTGKDEWLLQEGKALYKNAVQWVKETDLDLQFKKRFSKNHPSRW